MKSFFSVLRKALHNRALLGLISLTILGLAGGGSVLFLRPTSTHAASDCSYSTVRPGNIKGYIGAIHYYNAEDIAHRDHLSDINSFVSSQRLCLPKHIMAATEAQKLVYVPTPTVTQTIPIPPPPTGGQTTGRSTVAAMIDQVFGSYAQVAIHVATCESGLNPYAYNPASIGGSHAEGVFQILYPSTWRGTPEASSSPYNAMANIVAAHAIFVRDGYNWHEWSC